MLDIAEELDSIRCVFFKRGIEFALCGGMAMAIHGFVRATIDLDLLVKTKDVAAIQSAAESLEYIVAADCISRIDAADGDTMMLDLAVVTEETHGVWDERQAVMWREKPLPIVSRDGLIKLKRVRDSLQDRADIARLPPEIDYSQKSIELRVKRVSQLRNLCLRLAKAGAEARKKGQLKSVTPSTSKVSSHR